MRTYLTYLMIVGFLVVGLAPLGAQVDTTADPVAIAEREVLRGWSPRTVEVGDAVVFPFGHSQPTVTCAPLRACVIELEAGERVLATALGDTERWLIDQAGSGAGGRTPLLIVKPTACDLGTNLVVSTDRRVYDLALDAPACGHRAARYTRHVRFYYPAALVARAEGAASGDAVRPESLAFTYRWSADGKIPWAPAAVYDDGVHAFVRLGADARKGALPVLFLELADGSTAVLNYVVANDTYITDRVFARAILRGTEDGRRPRQVEIINTRLFARE